MPINPWTRYVRALVWTCVCVCILAVQLGDLFAAIIPLYSVCKIFRWKVDSLMTFAQKMKTLEYDRTPLHSAQRKKT